MSVGNPAIGGAPASTFQMPSATVQGANPLAQYQPAPQGMGPMPAQQQSASIPIPGAHLGPNPEGPGYGTGGFVMPPAGPSQPQGMPQLNLQPPTQQQPAPQFQPTPQFGAPQQFAPQFAPQQQAAPMFAPAPQQQPQPFQFNDGMSLGGAAGGFVPTAGQSFPPAPQPQQQPQYGFGFAPQQPSAVVPAPIRDNLVRQGLAVGHYRSDDELLADIGQIAASAQAIQSQAQWAAANGQQPQGGTQQQPPQPGQQPGAAGQQQPPAAAAPTKPQPPEWNADWNQFIRLDPQTGLYVPASVHVNPLLAQKANEYKSWQRQQAEKLLTNPMEVIGPDLEAKLKTLKDEAKQEVRAEIAAESRRVEGARIVDDFVTKNQAVFFQSGPDGKPAVNPLTGQYVFTPRGQAAMTYGANFRQQFAARYGRHPDPADVVDHVQKSLAYDEARGVFGPPLLPQMPGQMPAAGAIPQFGAMPPQQQFMPPPTVPFAPQGMPYPGVAPFGMTPPQYAAPQFTSPQDDMVRRAIAMQQAGYAPQPAGTIQHAMQHALAPQNPGLDFKSMLRQSAQARGISTEHFSS